MSKDKLKKAMLCIHIDEFDKNYEHGARRMVYQLSDNYTDEQIKELLQFANEVNCRFCNTRISFSGIGYIPYIVNTDDN